MDGWREERRGREREIVTPFESQKLKKRKALEETAKLKQEFIREKREGEEDKRKDGERERKKRGREPLL